MKKVIIYFGVFVVISGLVWLSIYFVKNRAKYYYEMHFTCPDSWVSHMDVSFTINGRTFMPSADYVGWARKNCSIKPVILD